MQMYQLKPHVGACVESDTVVFLNLRADRYYSVPLDKTPYLSDLHCGNQQADAAKLIVLDLIESVHGEAPPALPLRARAPSQRLSVEAVAPGFWESAGVLAACAATASVMARRRLDLAFAGLARRKACARAQGARPEHLAGAFEVVRPWYPKARVCLFDGLALMRFMLEVGLKPTLVVGVRARPFAAHCWLEIGGKLASDASDYCASFQPIAWV
jgi:hypothetical protein